MKIKKRIVEVNNENKIEAIPVIGVRLVGDIDNKDHEVRLLKTCIKHRNHEVFEARKDFCNLFVYQVNDHWEIFDKGNCIMFNKGNCTDIIGSIKRWEIMQVLNDNKGFKW